MLVEGVRRAGRLRFGTRKVKRHPVRLATAFVKEGTSRKLKTKLNVLQDSALCFRLFDRVNLYRIL